MKILIEETLKEEAANLLAGNDVVLFATHEDDRAAITAKAQGADSMVLRWPLTFPVDAEFLAACPDLKHVHKSGSGLEHADVLHIDACTQAGVMFSNNAGLNADVVAEHAILLTLMAMRPDTLTHMNRLREGHWDAAPAADVPRPRTLVGKTVGIVGLGQIGTCVAARMQAMRVGRILGYQRTRRFEQAYFAGVEWVDLRELLETSDVIVLCLPLSPATTGLISRELVAAIKPDAVLVNVGRGGVIDEAALFEAVRDGRIASVGLDVLEVEPSDSPLMKLPNAFVTPHTAGTAVEMQQIQRQAAVEAAAEFARRRRPPRLVNPQVLRSAALRAGWLGAD
ncbi:NAD(P)-dependent oxidoreductase [Aureimonas fodinaquatilis]|uniref:NAD(P)-dependent oxidoreductase n=1 Tax=Aureimonas fodinaquatilis TaxID=2565783 RepID=UPI00165E1837|nr:NAD(P)-dependent oxidoreductase [Aureimonas fodinaquatilis]